MKTGPALNKKTLNEKMLNKEESLIVGSDHAGFRLKRFLIETYSDYDWRDIGIFDEESSDYPDQAELLCTELLKIPSSFFGCLICGSGQGMAIKANRFPGIRAAVIMNEKQARLAREHNNANVLCLGANFISNLEASKIFETFTQTSFKEGRHKNRVAKLSQAVLSADPPLFSALEKEAVRQREGLELIASENYTSPAVMQVQGSVLTNKYAEGYPGKRYYGGCSEVDICEELAINRAKELFGAEHVNVQPHSGSGANMAVYFAMARPGDVIMGMDLAHGGHLTHGSSVNFSGFIFKPHSYSLNSKTQLLDYDRIEAEARKYKPRILIAGHSAYPRLIDFKKFREIADQVGALLHVDMAHFAGLVAAGVHPSPIPYADFVTSTTHKTLRGPRGGLILCRTKYAKDIDKAIFPGIQGGPLMHVIAAKAVCFREALTDSFKEYGQQILLNAQALASALQEEGFSLVTGGTDNHLMLVDLSPKNITGKEAEIALDKAGITINKNTIPGDTRSPFVTSGIRLGTPALTTRGMKENEMKQVARYISTVLHAPNSDDKIKKIALEVKKLCSHFPVL